MFFTDPFMYEQEQVCDLSLKIIDKLNANNIRCTVLTKGVFPNELGNRNGYSNKNEYGITLVSLMKNSGRTSSLIQLNSRTGSTRSDICTKRI